MRLKDISQLTPQYKGQPINGDVSFVPMESLRNGSIDLKEISYSEGKGKYTFFRNGDLLVAKVTPCFENGNIAIAENLKEGIGFGSSEIFVLRMNEKALNKYVFYLTQSSNFQDAACATMCGVGGLKRISPLFMKTYELDLPSINEQHRMVSYLDKKTTEIDSLVDLLGKKLDAFISLKASLIQSTVTKGLDENVRVKDSGIEWVGMVPTHWGLVRYKNYISLSKGKTPKDFTFESNGLPYLTMDYLRDREGKMTMYPEETKDLVAIEENRILVLWDGANAGEFIKSKQGYLGSTMAVLDVREFDLDYLFYFLKSIEQTSKHFASGTTIPHFDSRVLLNYDYPVPPISEQRAIAEYLNSQCQVIDHNIENIEKQIDAYSQLRKSLINEVITGKRAV